MCWLHWTGAGLHQKPVETCCVMAQACCQQVRIAECDGPQGRWCASVLLPFPLTSVIGISFVYLFDKSS